jgi:hypothetical protein
MAVAEADVLGAHGMRGHMTCSAMTTVREGITGI